MLMQRSSGDNMSKQSRVGLSYLFVQKPRQEKKEIFFSGWNRFGNVVNYRNPQKILNRKLSLGVRL